MGKKKQANQLGRSLIKDRFNQGHRRKVDNDTMVSKLRRHSTKKKEFC